MQLTKGEIQQKYKAQDWDKAPSIVARYQKITKKKKRKILSKIPLLSKCAPDRLSNKFVKPYKPIRVGLCHFYVKGVVLHCDSLVFLDKNAMVN